LKADFAGSRSFRSGKISLVTSDAATLVAASVPEKEIQCTNRSSMAGFPTKAFGDDK